MAHGPTIDDVIERSRLFRGRDVTASLLSGGHVNRAYVVQTGAAVSTEMVKEYADLYRLAPELAAGGGRHASLRYAARIEAGLAL